MSLAEMIQSQADAVERLSHADFAAQAGRLSRARRVYLVGTGTSQHAAELGTLMLERAGIDARWRSSAHFARWMTPPNGEDAVVLITHTAETAFARRSRAEALDRGVPLVSITGIGSGWPDAIETIRRETSETYTASYTAALTVLARLAHHLGADEFSPDKLQATADAVRHIMGEPGIDHIGLPARAVAVIGAGPWAITAREGALKIREAARILAEGFEAENYLHGSAVPFGAADGLLLLEPDADVDGLVAALGEAARQEGIQVGSLTAPRVPGSDLLSQIPMTVRLQLLASRFADVRRQNPDVAIVGSWARPELWALGGPTR
jgi:glucosamine--fructose-6-phosphate aminotransferase (isomerizing)